MCLFYGKWSKGLLGKHTHTKKAFHNLNQPKIAFFFFMASSFPAYLGHLWSNCSSWVGFLCPQSWCYKVGFKLLAKAWHYWLRKKREYPRNAEHRSCMVAWVSQEALQAPRVAGLQAGWMLSSWSHQFQEALPRFLTCAILNSSRERVYVEMRDLIAKGRGFPLGRGGGGIP